MKIYLIRHGQTTGDIEDRFGGDYDDDLTEEGEKQARNLAKKLKNKGIQIIFSSPLKRAQQTSKILSKELKVKIKTVKGIKERNRCGILTGMVRSEAQEKYPIEFEKIKEFKNTIKGAEDYKEFIKRIKKTFKQVLKENYKTTAIVTHGGPLGTIFEKILKLKYEKAEDCGYAVLEQKNGKLKIDSINRIVVN